MKLLLPYNNFARGQLDFALSGRYDLPIFSSGLEICKNFFTNFMGNAYFRPGFENMLKFEDCRFIEFKFSDEQDYIALFYNGKIRFVSYDSNGDFGFVLDGSSNILEVTSPYTLAHCKELSADQNADVMYIAHNSYEPRKLTRLSANSFTLSTFVRTEDPFASPSLTVSDSSSSSNTMATGDLTFTVSSGKGYLKYQPITITHNSTNYMRGTVKSYSSTTLVVSITEVVGSGTYTSWTIAMTSVGWPSCVRFYKGRLGYAGPSGRKTNVYLSVAGIYDDFTVPSSDVQDDDAVIFAVSELTEQIKWLMAAKNALIAGSSGGVAAIHGAEVGDAITPSTVDASVSNSDGANSTQPIKKDVFLFYLSARGRNANYLSYDMITENFKAEDANFASYDITAGGIQKLVYIKGKDNLVFSLRNDGVLLSLNFNQPEKIVGWSYHPTDGTVLDIAKMYNPNTSEDNLFLLVERDNGVFIERLASEVEFPKIESFYTGDDNEETDKETYWRYVAELLKDCIYLDNATVYKELYSSTITFNGTDTITSTASDFSSSDVGRRIVYKSGTGGEKGIFEITSFTSATSVKVQVLTTPTSNTYSSWYKSFTTISGLTDYASTEVSVVGDGGYLGEYTVSAAGVLTLDRPATVACLGFLYDGLLKTFNLGFMSNGICTQTLNKTISKVVLRFIASAGGEVGTSLYKMEKIQEFDPSGFYDLPPLPMVGDSREIALNDSDNHKKSLYIRQREPLPFHVVAVFPDVNYVTKS